VVVAVLLGGCVPMGGYSGGNSSGSSTGHSH
jgi:hypothetical protein